MNTYLIDLDKSEVVGRFDTEAKASAYARSMGTGCFEVLTEKGAECSAAELVKVFNTYCGEEHQVNRFANKATAVKRLATLLDGTKVPTPVLKPVKHYRIKDGADFSKRRGGYRQSLDAIKSGLTTVTEVLEKVREWKGTYKRSDVYTDIYLGKQHGYLEEVNV